MERKERHNGETEHIVNKAKGRYVRKGKLKRNSRSNFTSISKGGELDEIENHTSNGRYGPKEVSQVGPNGFVWCWAGSSSWATTEENKGKEELSELHLL